MLTKGNDVFLWVYSDHAIGCQNSQKFGATQMGFSAATQKVVMEKEMWF